jgi:23S rRNA (uracil1939-C5)-methyltransferase/tRNA (uracil-5-)-methyltransferase
MLRIPKNFRPVPFEYHQQIEVEIDTLTNLGSGLGRVDGWVVMVPLALPGERVKASVWRNKANYSDADLVEVLRPSPDRVVPRCPLFATCGGCQYQHISYAAQLEWKRRHVEELVRRLAGLEVKVENTWPSPLQFGYRSKITPHFDPPAAGRELAIGFLGMNTRATIDIPQCPIASDAINAALPAVREDAREKIRAGKMRKGGTLLLRDTGAGIETNMNGTASTQVGRLRFNFPAGEFFQNNPHILTDMLEYAISQACGGGQSILVDAYCGAGTFSLWAADRFEAVTGIEINEKSTALARSNAAANGISNCEFVTGSAEAIFSQIMHEPSRCAVLIDPPRAGCDEVFLEQLLRFGPARVVYVSCAPDTQARDLRHLTGGGYTVTRIQPFDLFPQTRHIESVATLVKSAG